MVDMLKTGNALISKAKRILMLKAETGIIQCLFRAIKKTLVITFPGSIDELKSYLAAQYAAGTPVQIAYKLAEPVPFTATGAQPISALSGANTVITDADSVTVTGRADPIKRIIDLEDAVASMTTT